MISFVGARYGRDTCRSPPPIRRGPTLVRALDGTVQAGTARVGTGTRGLKAGRSFQRMESSTVHSAGDSTHRFSSTGLRSFTVHGVMPPTILAISMDRMD